MGVGLLQWQKDHYFRFTAVYRGYAVAGKVDVKISFVFRMVELYVAFCLLNPLATNVPLI